MPCRAERAKPKSPEKFTELLKRRVCGRRVIRRVERDAMRP